MEWGNGGGEFDWASELFELEFRVSDKLRTAGNVEVLVEVSAIREKVMERGGELMGLSDRRCNPLPVFGAVAIALGLVAMTSGKTTLALPPPEDIPEEVLREEVILQGRSPIDGRPLSPVEYAELEAELREFPEDSLAVHPGLRDLIFQLKLLRVLKAVVPFWD